MKRNEQRKNIRFSSFHGYTGRCIRSVISPTLPLLLSWELYYLVFTLRSFLDFCYSRSFKRKKRTVQEKGSNSLILVLGYWKVSPPHVRKVVIGL
jgi:hypothetical protein